MARLEDMETFVRVVEVGSISGAAERLGVAKSVVLGEFVIHAATGV